MNKDKRAVTPIIATVLLIAIVVVASLIVFIWAKSFMKERVMKLDQLAETLCSQVSLSVGLDGNTLSITNTGNIPVYQVNLKRIKDKESESENVPLNNQGINPGEIFEKDIVLSDETQIIITPGLLGESKGSKKVYPCDEKQYGTIIDVVGGTNMYEGDDGEDEIVDSGDCTIDGCDDGYFCNLDSICEEDYTA